MSQLTHREDLAKRAGRAINQASTMSDAGELDLRPALYGVSVSKVGAYEVKWSAGDESRHPGGLRITAETLRAAAHNRRDSREYRKAIAYAYAAIMLQRLAAELGGT